MPKSLAEQVAAARASIENLSPNQVEQELQQGVMLVDIREPDEWERTGMIPGSVAAPRGMLEWYRSQ